MRFSRSFPRRTCLQLLSTLRYYAAVGTYGPDQQPENDISALSPRRCRERHEKSRGFKSGAQE